MFPDNVLYALWRTRRKQATLRSFLESATDLRTGVKKVNYYDSTVQCVIVPTEVAYHLEHDASIEKTELTILIRTTATPTSDDLIVLNNQTYRIIKITELSEGSGFALNLVRSSNE